MGGGIASGFSAGVVVVDKGFFCWVVVGVHEGVGCPVEGGVGVVAEE